MALSHLTTEDDTLDELGLKLRSIANINQDKLGAIQMRKNQLVVCGYTYSLDLNLPHSESESNQPWTLKATPVTKFVAESLEAWEYHGRPMEVPDNVFNDHIDYSVKKFSDVLRLNKQLLEVGCKFADRLADRPKTRSDMRTFIANMEKLQSEIIELHQLTSGVEDTVSSSVKLRDGLQKIEEGFKLVVSELPNSKLSLNATEEADCECISGGLVKFEDPTKLSRKATLKGHTDWVRKMIYFEQNDTPYLASASDDDTIKVWDLSDNTLIATLKGHTGGVYDLITFKLNGMVCLASGSLDKTIKLWDITTASLITTLTGHTKTVWALASYQKNDIPYLASGCQDNTIKLWNLSNNNLITTLKGHPDAVNALTTYKHNNISCLASAGDDKTVKLWNLENNRLITTIETGHSDSIMDIVVFQIKNTMCLASGSRDTTIKLWDLNNNNIITTLTDHTGCVFALTTCMYNGFSCLASGDGQGLIKFWDIDLTCIATLKCQKSVLSLITFHDRNTPHLAVGSKEDIKLWTE